MEAIQEQLEAKISDYFSEDDLKLIEKGVLHAEKGTVGEIRVVIRMNYGKEFLGDLDGQALHDFVKHGLAKTRDKTGVLILIVIGARKFKILADKGIYEKLDQTYFDSVAEVMSCFFKDGKYLEGVFKALRDISNQLTFYFPRKPDDTNELPDEVLIEEE